MHSQTVDSECGGKSKSRRPNRRHQRRLLKRKSRKIHPSVTMVLPTANQCESTRESLAAVVRRPPSSLRPKSQLLQQRFKTLPSIAASPLRSSARACRSRRLSGCSLLSSSHLDTSFPSFSPYVVNMRPPTRTSVGYDIMFEPARTNTRPTLSRARVLSDSPSSSLFSLSGLSDLELSPSPSVCDLEYLSKYMTSGEDSAIAFESSLDNDSMSESSDSESESECDGSELPLQRFEIDPKLLFGPSYKTAPPTNKELSVSQEDSGVCDNEQSPECSDSSDDEESSECTKEVVQRKNPNASRWDGGRYFTSRKPPLHPSARRKVFGSLEKFLFC